MLEPNATELPQDAATRDVPPRLTFRVTVRTTATPEAVYEVLADLRTHRTWAGEDAPRKDFRLLTLEAPDRPAIAGDRFSSTGANSVGSFSDRSVVMVADPGRRFGHDTEATLVRKHRPTWNARFTHRYTIRPTDDGAAIDYVGEVRPRNYTPFWLFPGMGPGTRVMVQRMTRGNMENLARLAEGLAG
ncbi:MAG TPA: SRPBCC family protein [Actinomycetota bacterium]|nr:SRPBCC family protein [Actinomycetota bacterium]